MLGGPFGDEAAFEQLTCTLVTLINLLVPQARLGWDFFLFCFHLSSAKRHLIQVKTLDLHQHNLDVSNTAFFGYTHLRQANTEDA